LSSLILRIDCLVPTQLRLSPLGFRKMRNQLSLAESEDSDFQTASSFDEDDIEAPKRTEVPVESIPEGGLVLFVAHSLH
jgi:hypothetical protein